jgi:hypothetical protein
MMRYNGKNDEAWGTISRIAPRLLSKDNHMNKQKKLKQIHQKRLKAAHAKVDSKKKARYISKADRAKIEEIQNTSTDSEINGS